jgi:hypothetical protein
MNVLVQIVNKMGLQKTLIKQPNNYHEIHKKNNIFYPEERHTAAFHEA